MAVRNSVAKAASSRRPRATWHIVISACCLAGITDVLLRRPLACTDPGFVLGVQRPAASRLGLGSVRRSSLPWTRTRKKKLPRPRVARASAEAEAQGEQPLLSRRTLVDALNLGLGAYVVYTLARIPFGGYIAALGDPNASSGYGAEQWGIWRSDPGPQGFQLKEYDDVKAKGGAAPAGWTFDSADWWLEEHGLVMPKPDFPLPPGKYTVSGDREVKSTLTIFPKDEAGKHRWELSNGATLYDVTHLPCRSARYTPTEASAPEGLCSPAQAVRSNFPVTPGAPMPPVRGCGKQDYAVLFVLPYPLPGS